MLLFLLLRLPFWETSLAMLLYACHRRLQLVTAYAIELSMTSTAACGSFYTDRSGHLHYILLLLQAVDARGVTRCLRIQNSSMFLCSYILASRKFQMSVFRNIPNFVRSLRCTSLHFKFKLMK